MTERNPYSPETPEWQLFENMKSLELAAAAFQADAERYIQKAADARVKSERYRDALGVLTDADAASRAKK